MGGKSREKLKTLAFQRRKLKAQREGKGTRQEAVEIKPEKVRSYEQGSRMLLTLELNMKPSECLTIGELNRVDLFDVAFSGNLLNFSFLLDRAGLLHGIML